jgi:tripartite-type tricarboxylate transporter receptor subunit TctC
MSFHRRSIAVALCVTTMLVAGSIRARAEDSGFYKGKTFNIVVGFPTGGGNDVYSRLIARRLPQYIPGEPAVIVQNMPAAGSMVAVKHLDANAPRDGTVMVNFQSGLITESIVSPEKVTIDFRNFSWIGVATGEYRVCYGFGPDGVKSWADLMARKQFVLGASAKGNAAYINAATLRDVFNAPIKIVLGYKGRNDQQIAIENGELDGDCGSMSSSPQAWIRDKKLHPFVRFTEFRPPEIPESATYIGDIATTEEQKELLSVLNAADELGRTFIMSKQVPADRVRTMRDAFNKVMEDKELLAEAEKLHLPVNPLTGEQAQAVVERMMSSASPEVVAKAKDIYE